MDTTTRVQIIDVTGLKKKINKLARNTIIEDIPLLADIQVKIIETEKMNI